MLERISDKLESLFGQGEERDATDLEPVHPRVLMIVHDPPVASQGNKRLTEIFNWHAPAKLAQKYIDNLRACSGGYLNYEIVERIDAGWYPIKEDGFRYTDETYLAAWRAKQPHEPDRIDYQAQIEAFEFEHRHRMGEFDEVWFYSSPSPATTNRRWLVPARSGATHRRSMAPSASSLAL